MGLNGVLRCAVEDPTRIIPETLQVSRKFARRVSRETCLAKIFPCNFRGTRHDCDKSKILKKKNFMFFCFLDALLKTNKIEYIHLLAYKSIVTFKNTRFKYFLVV